MIFCFLFSFNVFIYANCNNLYNDFKMVLEPQLTELCKIENSNNFLYKFYIKEESVGYSQMYLLIENNNLKYLFTEDDNISKLKCTDEKYHNFESVDEILNKLFNNKNCNE